MFDDFPEAERAIFAYAGPGGVQTFADPLDVGRRLRHCLGNVNAVLAEAHGENAEAVFGAEERVLDAVRFAFRLGPFDPATGEGGTEAACRAALAAYVEFMEQKKTRQPSLQTSSTPIQGGPTSVQYHDDTMSWSDSGPTPSG